MFGPAAPMAVRFRIVFATVGCAALPWGSTAADLRSCGLPDGDACKVGDHSLLQVTAQASRASRAKRGAKCCSTYAYCFDLGRNNDGAHEMACQRVHTYWGHYLTGGIVDCGFHFRQMSWWTQEELESRGDLYYTTQPDNFSEDECMQMNRFTSDENWCTFKKRDASGRELGQPKDVGSKPDTFKDVQRKRNEEVKLSKKRMQRNEKVFTSFDFPCRLRSSGDFNSCEPAKSNEIPEKRKWLTGNSYLPWVKIGNDGLYKGWYNYRLTFTCEETLSVCFFDECNDYYYKSCSKGSEPNVDYNSNKPAIKHIYVFPKKPRWANENGEFEMDCSALRSKLGWKEIC